MDTDAEMLEIPATMVASPLTPRYAETAADTVAGMDDVAFGPLNASIRRDYVGYDVSLPDDGRTYVASIERDAAGGATVEFVVDGQTQRVDFTAADFENYEPFVIDGREYLAGPWNFNNSNPLNHSYFRAVGWYSEAVDGVVGYQGQAVYGVRTKSENLPIGSASYAGYMTGNVFDDDGNTPRFATHRRTIWGELTLEADFDDSTVTGEVNGLFFRDTRENGEAWEELPDTTSIDIADGSIVGNRFTADWSGHDTDTNNPATASARGFEGDMLAEFYGPNAEEVGGVFNGHRAATATTLEQFVSGILGGKEQE